MWSCGSTIPSTRAALATVVEQLCELKARRARLEAERDDQPTLVFPEEPAAAEESETTTAGTLAGERTLFLLRRSARDGEKAHFSAFNRQTTSELNGVLTEIAADLTVEERTGASFYTARVGIPPVELARLKGLKLTPGMPVELFFPTGERTMLSYLIKPLSDRIHRTFREE
jgi:hypothetical protein